MSDSECNYWKRQTDQLRADKGELYQMLKAIVDTHRAGYAWMDMTKPQALLNRVVADHDELTLWTIEQLRAALDNMTEVARLAQEAAATAETRAVTRCAEIARNSCLSPPDGGSPTEEETACAEYAAQLIEKEYGL